MSESSQLLKENSTIAAVFISGGCIKEEQSFKVFTRPQ
jgi:hypothetical protein